MNPILVDLHKNPYSRRISLVIKRCPHCGKQHSHGAGEGHRISHCIDNKTGKSLKVGGYELAIDWSKKKNLELKDEYEEQLQELEGNC